MNLRERLLKVDPNLHNIFLALVEQISPILASIETLFPEYTRHDPSHNLALESLALDILTPSALESMSSSDLFVLLSALWLHDAGMGVLPEIARIHKSSAQYKEKLLSFERMGLTSSDCWKQYVRENHHCFCPEIARRFLSPRLNDSYVYWIGRIAESHGERRIHDITSWHKLVAVSDREHLHPSFLAAVLRLADILHINRERAPEFMQEHRRISNAVSINHWKAHQVVAGHTISDGACSFDGVTDDDEAFWFASQFIKAMDDELCYCAQYILPFLDDPLRKSFSFDRVQNRVKAETFNARSVPPTLRVDTNKFLKDLLTDSLYAGKPAWFREVLQNAFDACRDLHSVRPDSCPKVDIFVNTQAQEIEFSDTGVGMTPDTVERFLLVAGASFWQSPEYMGTIPEEKRVGHVGKFGIGFMSLFSVASQISVSTRHHSSAEAWQYTIRSPERIIRVERCERDTFGTNVKVKLKDQALAAEDPAELLDQFCTFPEFPLRLFVDGIVVRQKIDCSCPNATKAPLELRPTNNITIQAKLIRREIDQPGIRGDYHLPMPFVQTLQAFIPDMRGWVKLGGWQFEGKSGIYFGGINSPSISSLNLGIGFINFPSLGVLRLAVSPNVYPLEMNLARDRFIKGPASSRLHGAVCEILDDILADALETELAGKSNLAVRSAIAARHSAAMLHEWIGYVPGPSAVACRLEGPFEPVSKSPWKRITRIMMKEMRFGCLDGSKKFSSRSIEELVRGEKRVFAVPGNISQPLANAIFAFCPNALLLTELPDPNFGIFELRYWAEEQYLVPVSEHSRTAYGLRLIYPGSPFPFFPNECDYLGVPIGTGPSQYAALDFRDFMGEARLNPNGSNVISAVLNQKHPKTKLLIETLRTFSDFNRLKRAAKQSSEQMRECLSLGHSVTYGPDNRSRLTYTLNNLLSLGHSDCQEFTPSDFPTYFDRGQDIPFGQFGANVTTHNAYKEIEGWEGPRSLFS